MSSIYTLSDKKIDGTTPLFLLEFEYKEIECDLEVYDTLLITSKNSIKALKEKIDIAPYLSKKLYCIGEESAKIAKEMGFVDVESLESKNGNEFAKNLGSKLKERKALLLRPKKVVSKIKSTLQKEGIEIDEIVIYETKCKKSNIKLERGSVVIFSSPSSIECFFKNYSWRDDLSAVVIGEITATYMPKEIDFKLSAFNKLSECVKIAKKLLDEK
ncbi:MAG: uroporphyrinogen-III synthase [Campylobacterales bacterium]